MTSARARPDPHPRLDVAVFAASLALVGPSPRYCLAYSGGLDSHVLLHLFAAWRSTQAEPPECLVIHVHHGLHADADVWAAHCARTCADLCLPLRLCHVDARARPGQSPEEAAREARYRVLAEQMHPGDVLLTAQHQDDQAETLLLQLLRGAGLAGLAAMPRHTAFGPGWLLRPLLDHPRAALSAYARRHGLRWIEDPSNADPGYDRNYLRQTVMPLIKARWPAAAKTLSRSAAHCAEAHERLERISYELYRAAYDPQEQTLDIRQLVRYEPGDRRRVIRLWLRDQGFRMPAAAVLERIAREMIEARADRTPVVRWPEGEVRRYRQALYARFPSPPGDLAWESSWDGQTPLPLPNGNGVLLAEATWEGGIAQEYWKNAHIRVRYRQGREVCHLPGRAGGHTLKKLFQEAGIPPWERVRMPLIEVNGVLAAVADRWVCQPFHAAAGQPAIRLRWQR